MKRITILLIVMLSAVGCGFNHKELKVDYEVTTREQYEHNLSESKLGAKYADYQMLEIMSIIGSNSSVCVGDDIFVYDITKATDKISELGEDYSKAKFIFQEDVDRSSELVITKEMTEEELLEKITESSSIRLDGKMRSMPVTEYMLEKSKSAEYKYEFVKSLMEVVPNE